MSEPIRVDIVSDVVCPWCIVGYRQLKQASKDAGQPVEIYWHPFELNPDMVPEGEGLREHIMRKYGSTKEQSDQAREALQNVGKPLGIDFCFSDDSRIYNTFDAHRLLHWASQTGKTHDLKQALFHAYFTQAQNVSDADALLNVVDAAGLDRSEASMVLATGQFAKEVREKEQFWQRQGVQGVPAMVFSSKHLVTGAQGTDTYARILEHLAAEAA